MFVLAFLVTLKIHSTDQNNYFYVFFCSTEPITLQTLSASRKSQGELVLEY
tara:strand:- start:1623 stop:1775 length:153 start_codon:yes stop_codon:yes gene_type:complete